MLQQGNLFCIDIGGEKGCTGGLHLLQLWLDLLLDVHRGNVLPASWDDDLLDPSHLGVISIFLNTNCCQCHCTLLLTSTSLSWVTAQYVNCAAANPGADAGMYDASEQYKLSTNTITIISTKNLLIKDAMEVVLFVLLYVVCSVHHPCKGPSHHQVWILAPTTIIPPRTSSSRWLSPGNRHSSPCPH